MRHIKAGATVFFAFFILSVVLSSALYAADRPYPHPSTYAPSIVECFKQKSFYDDPRPWLKTFGVFKHLPKDMLDKLTFDIDEMKKDWSDLVGLKAPDLVGKISPHIKPGTYSYRDVQADPEFQKLFWPEMLDRIKPGGPPFCGNIAEFEIIPTQQYYWSLPISRATRENLGKTKLDGDGYLVQGTWISGYPFPKPSGEHKARQVMYNFEKRQVCWGWNFWQVNMPKGWSKDLKEDLSMTGHTRRLQLSGRCAMEPYGSIDALAEKKKETHATILSFNQPRDSAGTVLYTKFYQDPETPDVFMVYLPSLRRVRKMSTTDTQDPMFGADNTYDDMDGFTQKISKTRFPYTYKIIGEREYLVPTLSTDGSEYFTKEGLELRGAKLERRPVYMVELLQLDSNYVYGKRIAVVDKELFIAWAMINYDQKGRLYRVAMTAYGWIPEMGMVTLAGPPHYMTDSIDLHSSSDKWIQLPALWDRDEVTMKSFIGMK